MARAMKSQRREMGQARALIRVGGNPVLAFPDSAKAIAAIEDLVLQVCLDPFVSETAKLADYVLPAAIPLEHDDITASKDDGYEQPHAHYTEAVVDPPEGRAKGRFRSTGKREFLSVGVPGSDRDNARSIASVDVEDQPAPHRGCACAATREAAR